MRLEDVENYFDNIYDLFKINDFIVATSVLYIYETGKIKNRSKYKNNWFMLFIFDGNGNLLSDKKFPNYRSINIKKEVEELNSTLILKGLGLS